MMPQQKFWAKFAEHEGRLFSATRPQPELEAALQRELSLVHPDLAFEIGPPEPRSRRFVLTAHALRRAYPAAKGLMMSAPPSPRWKFQAFHERESPLVVSLGEDGDVSAEVVRCRFTPKDRDSEVEMVFVPDSGVAPADWDYVGARLLRMAIGEELQIRFVKKFEVLDPVEDLAGWTTLPELVAQFDAMVDRLQAG